MSTAVHYRDAHAADAPMIGAFLAERFSATFGYTYRAEDLGAFLAASYAPDVIAAQIEDPDQANHLAVQGEEIVGAIQTGPMGLPMAGPVDAGALELKRLYLADSVKGAGVADALMAWGFAVARQRGAQVMYLGVWSENVRAQRFYARHGFKKVGEYLFPVGATQDLEWILRADVA
jgi:diamine N-acetyltransferase